MDPAAKGIREARGGDLLPRCLLALGLVLAAVPVAVLLLSTAVGGPLTYDLADALSAWSGPWRVYRGVMSRLAMPSLLLILVVMVVALWRAHRRAAFVLALTVLLANLTVQAIKHSPVVPARQLALIDPMSGHVGVAAAMALGWVVVGPARAKAVSALCAVAAITGVSLGVVLAGWHTLPQVVCPLVICMGWSVAAATLVPAEGGSRWATTAGLRRGGIVVSLVSAIGFTALTLLAQPPPTGGGLVPSLLTLTGLLVVVASLAAVGTVLAVGRTA